MSTKKDPREHLNLRTNQDEFVLQEGIGNTIFYHGTEVDIRKIQRAKAEQIANDPGHRYLTVAPKEEKARIAAAQEAAASSTPEATGSGKSGKGTGRG